MSLVIARSELLNVVANGSVQNVVNDVYAADANDGTSSHDAASRHALGYARYDAWSHAWYPASEHANHASSTSHASDVPWRCTNDAKHGHANGLLAASIDCASTTSRT